MYRLERSQFLESKYIFLWATLAFQAGFINSFGFLVIGRYVSHVTGMGTQIGIAIAKSEWFFAAELLLIPLFFIIGAFVSGILTSVRIEKNLKPRYDLVMLAMPGIILCLMILASENFFGNFIENSEDHMNPLLAMSLSALCGMQNACFATLTKGQIRTTHLTGISTDLGTDLARSFFGKLTNEESRLVRRTNISRIATIVAFSVGAVVSVIYSPLLEYKALTIPILLSSITFIGVSYESHFISKSTRILRKIAVYKNEMRRSSPKETFSYKET